MIICPNVALPEKRVKALRTIALPGVFPVIPATIAMCTAGVPDFVSLDFQTGGSSGIGQKFESSMGSASSDIDSFFVQPSRILLNTLNDSLVAKSLLAARREWKRVNECCPFATESLKRHLTQVRGGARSTKVKPSPSQSAAVKGDHRMGLRCVRHRAPRCHRIFSRLLSCGWDRSLSRNRRSLAVDHLSRRSFIIWLQVQAVIFYRRECFKVKKRSS